MMKRILAMLTVLLVCTHAVPAQNLPVQPGANPGAAQPAAGGAGGPAQPGGQPTLPGGKSASPGGQAGGVVGGKQPMPGVGAPGGMSGLGGGQKKAKDLSDMSLDELLNAALKDNADISVAQAKVRETEAELHRTRLQVMQKVSRLVHDIKSSREAVKDAEANLRRVQQLVTAKAISVEEYEIVRRAVERAKVELAKFEAELPFLVGKQPAGMGGAGMMGPGGGGGTFLSRPLGIDMSRMEFAALELAAVKNVPTSVADKLHKALDTEVLLRQSEMTLHDAVSFLSDKMQDINVHISDKKLNTAKVNLYLLRPVSMGAMFQYFEDELECRCIIREYGIVIVPRDRVPPGATSLLEFWKKSRSVESKPK